MKGVGEGAVDATTSTSGLGPEFDKAAIAAERLSQVQGIRGLNIAVVNLRLATDELRASFGGVIPPAAEAQLAKYEAQITSMTGRLGELRERQSAVATSSLAVGQGWTLAASTGHSMTAMMEGMARTSEGLVGSLAKAGLYTFGVVEAFKVGFAAGEKLREGLVALGFELPDLSNKLAALIVGIKDTGEAFDRVGIASASLHGRFVQQQNDFHELHSGAEKLISGMRDLFKAESDFGTAQADVTKEIRFFKEHGRLDEWAKLNGDALVNFYVKALKDGRTTIASIPPEIKAVLESQLKWTEGLQSIQKEHDKLAETVGKAYVKIADERQKAAVVEKKAVDDSVVASNAAIKQLNSEVISAEEYSARKKEIAEKEAVAIVKAYEDEKTATKKYDDEEKALLVTSGLTLDQIQKAAIQYKQLGTVTIEAATATAQIAKVAPPATEAVQRQAEAVREAAKAAADLKSGYKDIVDYSGFAVTALDNVTAAAARQKTVMAELAGYGGTGSAANAQGPGSVIPQ